LAGFGLHLFLADFDAPDAKPFSAIASSTAGGGWLNHSEVNPTQESFPQP